VARKSARLPARVRKLSFPIRTPRLELVPPATEHAEEIVELFSEPSVARWTVRIPFPYRLQDAREHVRRARLALRTGKALSLQVLRRSDGRVVGGVGLHGLNESHVSAELGYWVGRPYRRLGYGSEAARAMVRLAFRRLRLHRVEARVFPGNRASIELLKRCGFRLEGLTRDEIRKSGVWQSTLLFSRLATDRFSAGRPRRRA
jgi:[ribosomal protein S5]-alanine N-acetyltransferase